MPPIDEIPSVGVTVIGSTGDGTGFQTDKTLATTPGNAPNVVVTVIGPMLALLIRAVNVFLPVFAGILTGAMSTDLIPASDFADLAMKCASLSLAGTSVALIKDLITIFGKLESRFPLLTGSV